jgi:hypothetical protein
MCFDHDILFSREKQLVPYAWQCLCVFCLHSEALSSKSYYDEISHLLHSPDLVPADFPPPSPCSLKWKLPSEEKDFRTSRRV